MRGQRRSVQSKRRCDCVRVSHFSFEQLEASPLALDDMVDSTESTLKQLRKSFQLIFKLSQEWGSTSAQVSRNVRAAANLIPRLRSIPESKAPALGVLAHFHNIRERLCQKHLEQLDLLVRALNAAQ